MARPKLKCIDIIKKFRKRHPDSDFDYSKNEEYFEDYDENPSKTTKDKITIICPKHGEFVQTIENHFKYGCMVCRKQIKTSKEELLKRFKNKHSNKYDYSKFEEAYDNGDIKSVKSKTTFICPEHGEFIQTVENHYKSGCPSCGNILKSSKKRVLKNRETFLEKLDRIYKTGFDNILNFLIKDLKIKEENISIEEDVIVISFDDNREKIGLNIINLKTCSFGPETVFGNQRKYKLIQVNKLNRFENRNINTLTIYPMELLDPFKLKIWKSIIRNKLGKNANRVYARKTIVKEVDGQEAKEFLDNNHMQQSGTIGPVKLGLYTKDTNKLVSLMTFGKSRYDKKIDWELLRFCSLIDYTVVGAANKLFKHFKNPENGYFKEGETIISYANRKYAYLLSRWI